MPTDRWSLEDVLDQIIRDLGRCLTWEFDNLPIRVHGVTLASMELCYMEVIRKVIKISSVALSIPTYVAYRRNALTKINSLPNEILCKIFMETSEGYPLHSMRLSHTCSHWRDVSINCASLWSHINISELSPRTGSRVDLMALFLERTREYPVFVWSSSWMFAYIPEDILTLIGHHISHIYSLQVSIVGADLHKQQHHGLFQSAASLLKHLTIYSNDNGFLPNLFEGGTPALTDLTLRDCRIVSWTHPYYKGLTHLDMDNITLCDNRDYGGNADFLEVLRSCPLLESMRLVYGFDADISTIYTTTDVISLPRLRILILNADSTWIIYILSHISAPNIYMQLSCYFENPHDMTLLLPHLREHFPVFTSHFPDLVIDLNCDELQISFLPPERRSMASHQSEALMTHRIDMLFDNWLWSGERVFQNVISSCVMNSELTWSHLEINCGIVGLNLQSDEKSIIVDTLLALLRDASSITLLTLDNLFPEFWSALAIECQNPYFLPALTTIEFTGMHMEYIEEVITTWQSERRAGSHLQEVWMIGEHYVRYNDMLLWLKKIVEKVETLAWPRAHQSPIECLYRN